MTNQGTQSEALNDEQNASTSTDATALILRISGYGVETFAGDVDFATYKYFEENDIDLGEYHSMAEFGDEDGLDIPEEHHFASWGLTEIDNKWHINGAYLDEDSTIEIIDADEKVIWKSNCDLDSLTDAGISLLVTSNYDDLVEELQSEQAMLVGRLFQQGTIFDTSLNGIDEFDASNLTIYYFEDESGAVISSIEYGGEPLDNEDSFTETSDSEFIWEAR